MLRLNKIILTTLLKIVVKLIKSKKMSEYIWYCPRNKCNSIITKTKEPILGSGSVYKCKRCKCDFSCDELVFHNKKNLKKYLHSLI